MTARDAAAGRAAAACAAIRGIFNAAGLNDADLPDWEEEVVRSLGPDPKVSRRLFATKLDDNRNVFSRYAIIGVICLAMDAPDPAGTFYGIEAWDRMHSTAEVDGVRYRYLYERQEF